MDHRDKELEQEVKELEAAQNKAVIGFAVVVTVILLKWLGF